VEDHAVTSGAQAAFGPKHGVPKLELGNESITSKNVILSAENLRFFIPHHAVQNDNLNSTSVGATRYKSLMGC
jgi:hypothetical protein